MIHARIILVAVLATQHRLKPTRPRLTSLQTYQKNKKALERAKKACEKLKDGSIQNQLKEILGTSEIPNAENLLNFIPKETQIP